MLYIYSTEKHEDPSITCQLNRHTQNCALPGLHDQFQPNTASITGQTWTFIRTIYLARNNQKHPKFRYNHVLVIQLHTYYFLISLCTPHSSPNFSLAVGAHPGSPLLTIRPQDLLTVKTTQSSDSLLPSPVTTPTTPMTPSKSMLRRCRNFVRG